MIADVGGTTTDIALLDQGRPKLDPAGARVGGFEPWSKQSRCATTGLGGDSRLQQGDELRLGPERSIPLSLLAHDDASVAASLEAQIEREPPRKLDGQFAVLLRTPSEPLSKSQQALVDLLAPGPRTLEQVIERHHLGLAYERLLARGLIGHAGFTPSDAAHCLGLQTTLECASSSPWGKGLKRAKRQIERYGLRSIGSGSQSSTNRSGLDGCSDHSRRPRSASPHRAHGFAPRPTQLATKPRFLIWGWVWIDR